VAFGIDWVDGRETVAKALKEAHRRRHAEGRLEGQRWREKHGTAREERASRRARDEWNRGFAAMRRRRLRQQAEEERDRRRLGAALRKANRQMEKDARDASFYAAFEQKLIDCAPTGDRHARDLIADWYSRGFDSGRERTDSGRRKPNSARTAEWSPGEFGEKIRYIYREGAREDVDGNFLSNMGDMEEAIACAHAVEDAEGMSRGNGGVYKHVIIALPHQLTPLERLALLEELVAPLREMGLPFCAALHRPDPKGDPRNFHAHILHSQRPMTYEGPNQWSFAASKLTWFDCREGMLLQRRLIAAAFNRALERAGHEERWTSMSRERRGLPSPGNTKKGPEQTRAERDATAAEAAAEAARSELREREAVAAGAEALLELSDRLEDIFSRRMKERRERDSNEPPTWEEEEARQMNLADERARAQGRPVPTNIFYGIEEPEEESPASTPAPAIAVDAGRIAREDAGRRREEARREEAAKEVERRRRKRMTLLAREAQVARSIGSLPTPMNDPAAFERVRAVLTRNPTSRVHCAWPRSGDLVIGADDRAFVLDVCRISECEAGRRYLVAVSPALDPWPEFESQRLYQAHVPGKPYPTASVADQHRHRTHRGRGR
jgi:MobA/MobL family